MVEPNPHVNTPTWKYTRLTARGSISHRARPELPGPIRIRSDFIISTSSIDSLRLAEAFDLVCYDCLFLVGT